METNEKTFMLASFFGGYGGLQVHGFSQVFGSLFMIFLMTFVKDLCLLKLSSGVLNGKL